MKNNATPIKDVLKSVFLQLEKSRDICREDVEERWKRVVGEGGFRHSRPVLLRKGVLTVRVDNSSWMQEMAMRKRKLLKQLKTAFGKDKISEIHFKIGEI